MSETMSESEALDWMVRGAVLGASTRGVIVCDADVRAALEAGTEAYPGTQRVRDLVETKAREQGVPFADPLP